MQVSDITIQHVDHVGVDVSGGALAKVSKLLDFSPRGPSSDEIREPPEDIALCYYQGVAVGDSGRVELSNVIFLACSWVSIFCTGQRKSRDAQLQAQKSIVWA